MNTEQNKKVEEILGSLDGCARASAPDFFYTRLSARLEKELATPEKPSWILRPAFALAAMAVVILINVFAFLQRSGSNFTPAETDQLQSVAAEYRLNENTNLYDLTALADR
ncbi:MAG: hypothetical protein JNM88_07095 [Chitinophagaceae bacterium]|nr:hypothetical protein [Chitinophagaceae bacterium]